MNQDSIKDLKRQHAHCRFCHQNYSCGVIKMALNLVGDLGEPLDAESGNVSAAVNTSAARKLKNLRQDLESKGYEFPYGDEPCKLSDDPEELKKLVVQAQEIVKEWQREN